GQGDPTTLLYFRQAAQVSRLFPPFSDCLTGACIAAEAPGELFNHQCSKLCVIRSTSGRVDLGYDVLRRGRHGFRGKSRREEQASQQPCTSELTGRRQVTPRLAPVADAGAFPQATSTLLL